MIVKNNGSNHVFITTKWHPSSDGGPAISETTYYVGPGDQIDLAILDFEPVKVPKKNVVKKRKRIANGN